MATLPTITCRAAFGQAFTNGSPTWTDISAYFRRASTRRGRARLQRTAAQFVAGTATIALDNRDRRFDPTNTASPYWPNIQPGVLINLRATWNGVTYDLFTGYVDNWPVRWPGRAEAETEISVTDLFGILAKRLIVNGDYANVVQADSPVSYWKLNEPAGSTVAADSVGTATGAPTDVTFGAAGLVQSSSNTSAGFSGSGSSQITATAPAITSTSPWSLEFWIQVPVVGAGTGTIYSDWNNGNGLTVAYNTAATINVALEDAGGTTVSSFNLVQDQQPHHIVIVRSSPTVTIYIDGVGQGPSSNTRAPSLVGAVTIGSPLFPGRLAQVARYSTALSAAQVAAHYNAGTPFVQQTTGARVNAILDAVGFPSAMRRVDTGRTIVPLETRSLATTTSLAYMQACETAEQGQLLIGPDGYVEFHNRYSRYGSTGAANQATFGDGGGELGIPVGAFNIDYDTTELFNTVPATRIGGATQIATDKTGTTGTDNIGERTAPGLSDVMLTSDADSLALAQWMLADTKQPYFRLDQLRLDPRGDANLWPHVLGRKVNDTVTANKHTVPGGGAAISLPSRIEGIDHTFGDLKWQTDLHLSQMGTSKWMIFDDSTCDALDGTNRLGW